jgi:hypothetical protein
MIITVDQAILMYTDNIEVGILIQKHIKFNEP